MIKKLLGMDALELRLQSLESKLEDTCNEALDCFRVIGMLGDRINELDNTLMTFLEKIEKAQKPKKEPKRRGRSPKQKEKL